MAELYVVYVAAPDQAPSSEDRLRLAHLLRLDSPKLDALLGRLPAEVTKPVPESTAMTVARRFREAGLEASIRRPSNGTPGGAEPDPNRPGQSPVREVEATVGRGPEADRFDHRPAPAAGGFEAAATADDERADERADDEVWRTQFGRKGSVAATDNEEDEFFPPSSFDKPRGPKAPSKPLVIALLVVLAVLAALWVLL